MTTLEAIQQRDALIGENWPNDRGPIADRRWLLGVVKKLRTALEEHGTACIAFLNGKPRPPECKCGGCRAHDALALLTAPESDT